MAYRLRMPDIAPCPKAKPKKQASYLEFLHRLPCVVTGVYGVEAAHLSFAAAEYGHYGRAKGRKASDRWALPLAAEQHRRQHSMNEREYWASVGRNPHELALVIHGLWTELGSDAEPFAVAVINQRIFG